MRAIRNWGLTPILFFLAACGGGGAVKMYDGDEKTATEVATVRLWSQNISVVAVDGKPTPASGKDSYAHVDPGEHEFTLVHLAATGKTEAKLRTMTRAGRSYVFGAKEVAVGRYGYFVEDKGRDYDVECLRLNGKGKDC